MIDDDEDDGDRARARHIRETGWSVCGILEDESGPAFAFTIGLTETFGHPEIMMQAQKMANMHGILNGVGAAVRGGAVYVDGARASDVLDGYVCGFRAVDRAFYRDYFGTALFHYKGRPFTVLQLLWPDANNHVPGDPQCDPHIAALQRLALTH